MKKILLFIFSLSLIISAQEIKITILETSDVHGKIFPYDFVKDQNTGSSLASVKYYLDSVRAETGENLLLLDNGDILQGSPAVYYYNYIDTSSEHLYASVMKYFGYDAGTVGNHDIEPGHPVYDKFREELNFPWLAANAVDTATGEPYFQPYTVFEKDGVKIAVLGLITPGIPMWLPPSIWSGIRFEDMVKSAENWLAVINEKENPDFVIGLFHSGVEFTYGGVTRETPRNENASLIVAEDVPGFDVVFVGHDHHGWNQHTVNTKGDSVLIIGPTSNARDIARVDITVNKSAGTKKINGTLVNLRNAPESQDFLDKFNPQFEAVKSFVNKPAGKLTRKICSRESITGNAVFTDLIHKIQLDISGADISFAAPLSMDICLDAGEVKTAHMFDLYRFENLLYTMNLSGEEIKNFLEYSVNLRYNSIDSAHIFKFKTENGVPVLNNSGKAAPANSFFNFDDAEGINYKVDLSKPEGERIIIDSLTNGEKFDLAKIYKVAVNSYRGTGGGGHLTKGSGIAPEELNNRIVSSTDADLRYYMIKYFEEHGEVDPVLTNNWKLIPEKEAAEKLKKDTELLFGN